MLIIDSQVHAYEANTPKRPWHTVPGSLRSVRVIGMDLGIDDKHRVKRLCDAQFFITEGSCLDAPRFIRC